MAVGCGFTWLQSPLKFSTFLLLMVPEFSSTGMVHLWINCLLFLLVYNMPSLDLNLQASKQQREQTSMGNIIFQAAFHMLWQYL